MPLRFMGSLVLYRSIYRSCASASTALDALFSVDNILAIAFRNTANRALRSTCAASDAVIIDFICHSYTPPIKLSKL